MNTIDRIELARIRANAAAKHRASKVHAEADRIERGWSDDKDFGDVWTLLKIAAWCITAFVIGLGIYSFASESEKVVEASATRALIAQCKEEGGTAQVSRDAKGVVLAVRCAP